MVLLHTVIRNTKAEAEENDSSKASLIVMFIHGLDSYSGTWTDTITSLAEAWGSGGSQQELMASTNVEPIAGITFVAIDQRGCGKSPPTNNLSSGFSQEALVEDVHSIVMDLSQESEPKNNIVLVGHSLGGRVALAYAATYPNQLAALVIEDMDIAKRSPSAGFFQVTKHGFERQGTSLDELKQRLMDFGYPLNQIDQWVGKGRIEELPPLASGTTDTSSGDSWWCNLNPDFRTLCYEHVLGTDNAKDDCRRMVADQSSSFPCYLLVAGDTVCGEDSIEEMKMIMGEERLSIDRFPSAGHSIHSSAGEDFLKTINTVLRNSLSRLIEG